jgi:hypothetical protein
VVRAGGGHTLVHPSIVAETGDAIAIRVYPPSMRGRLVLVGLTAVGVLSGACGGDGGHHATASTTSDEPLSATLTARGLTAGLLAHLDRGRVSWYGGRHDAPIADFETWSASAELEGDTRSVFAFVQRTPDSFDAGCRPDGPEYTVLSCATAPNGASRSLMQRTGGTEKMPVLEGRTTRPDGTSFLVEVFSEEVTEEAKDLVLELLDDEALAGRTTESMNAAGEALDDYHGLVLKTSIGDAAP